MANYQATLVDDDSDRVKYKCTDAVCNCGNVQQLLEQVFKNVQQIHQNKSCAQWAMMSIAVQQQVMVNVTMRAAILRLAHIKNDDLYQIAAAAIHRGAANMFSEDVQQAANIVADMEDDIATWIDNLLGATEKKEHH